MAEKSRLFSKRAQALLGAAVLLLTGIYVWKGVRLGSAETAEAVLFQLLDGRADEVYRMATPEEKEHLTLAEWKQVYHGLIAPWLRRFDVDRRGMKSESRAGDSVGNKWVQFKGSDKDSLSTGMTVWMSEQGATGPMLMSTLALVWRLDYLEKHGSDFRNGGLARAYYEGLRADRGALEAAGLRGIYFSPSEGFLEFDRVEDRWKKRIEAGEAKAVKGATS